MKEDIYLFYKRKLEPRINYCKDYLKYLRRQYKSLKQPFLSPSKPPFSYLLIGHNSELDSYYGFHDNLVFIDKEVFIESLDDLDYEVTYVLFGEYDSIAIFLNHLRKLGFKVIWNQMKPNNDGVIRKPLWKKRVSVVEAIYSDLIVEKTEALINNLVDKSEWDSFEHSIFDNYLNNKDSYKKIINKYLKEGWELERLHVMVTSILLEALSEFYSMGTPINVLIEQSVKTACHYCADEEFKLINALLANCLKYDSNTH